MTSARTSVKSLGSFGTWGRRRLRQLGRQLSFQLGGQFNGQFNELAFLRRRLLRGQRAEVKGPGP
jgi:hypothetical protein